MTSTAPTVQAVDLWTHRLGEEPVFELVLSPDELQRASRLQFRSDQAAFRLRRTLLRTTLGDFLNVDPQSIEFNRECHHCGSVSHGKPRIVGRSDVAFSTASTPDIAVVAITRGGPIGIDIERVDSVHADEVTGLTAAVFSQSERSIFGLSTDPVSAAQFTAAFTAKEAVGKGDGRGLLVDASSIAEQWIVTPLPFFETGRSEPMIVGALATSDAASVTVRNYDQLCQRGLEVLVNRGEELLCREVRLIFTDQHRKVLRHLA